MSVKQGRICPICFKDNLHYLGDHLRQVHQLNGTERKQWFKSAVFSPPTALLGMVSNQSMETNPYPDFTFNHMFSMLVVGPTQSGKTYFVEQLLTKNCVNYPNKKPKHITWYYNQWQSRYDKLQSLLGKEIQFMRGLPDMSEDLREINPKFNNILVFDDLMSQAIDSPVLSKLFTQGRHRNASVILLLQNMFPRGKFNTDI